MGNERFRRRPYLDLGIDLWKMIVVAVLFLTLLLWLAYTT